MFLDVRAFNLWIDSLSLSGNKVILLAVLHSLVLYLFELCSDLSRDLDKLSSLLLCLFESLSELGNLLLVVLFLGLENEDGIILELFLRHLLEPLDCFSYLIDVLHESLRNVVCAYCKGLATNELDFLVQSGGLLFFLFLGCNWLFDSLRFAC